MKRLSYLLVFVTTIVLCVFYACRKEDNNALSVNKPAFTVQQAQQWYVQNSSIVVPNTMARGGKDLLTTLGITPDWGNLHIYHFDSGKDIMEIPLLTANNLSYKIVAGNIDTALSDIQGLLPVENALRLLLVKDSSGIIHGATMEIIGSKDYLSSKQQQLKDNNFLKVDSTFTGMVIFRDYPTKNFIRGYQYENGILIQNVYSLDTTDNSKLDDVCVISIPWYYSVCDVNGDDCTYGIGGYDQVLVGCGGSDDGSTTNIPPDLPAGGGGSPTNTNNTNLSQMQVLPADPAKIIKDILNYFKCFTISATATYGIDVYVQEPKIGSRFPMNLQTSPGHTFLSLWENDNGNIIRRAVGFWPINLATPFNPNSSGTLQDDEGHQYNVHAGITNVAAADFINLIQKIESYSNAEYNLNTFNCTSFTIFSLIQAGIFLPETTQSWGIGGGLNPADLGEDIRTNVPITDYNANNIITRNYYNSYQYAPSNQGSCQNLIPIE